MPVYNQLGTLASGILRNEFDFITGATGQHTELLTISGSLSGLLGELNTFINTDYYFTADDVTGVLREEEQSILTEIYLKDYYFKEARKVLRGLYDTATSAAISTDNWTELREGDTVIRRSATMVFSAKERNITARAYRDLAEEADKKITELVYAYNMYGAVPRQVVGDDGYYACPNPTPTPTPDPTPDPTPSPTPSPTASPTPSPTASPTPSPSPTPSAT